MPRPDLARAAIGGILAGLAAGAVMNGFQAVWSEITGKKSDGEPTTVKAADKLAEATTGDKVAETYRKAADPAVHYATAGALGLIYGLAAEADWPVTSGFGTLFGAATAAVLDEGLVPLLGLAPPPTETPLATHAYGVASHVVFGGALEAARGLLRG